MKRLCKKCELEKNLDEMMKSKNSKDGYANLCKDCNRLKLKKYREDNKDYHDKYIKEYYNRPEVKERNRLKSKKYREDNKDYHDKYTKEYYSRPEVKEKNRLHGIKYREDNKDKLKQQKDKWREKNKDKIKQQKREYRKMKNETDPMYRLYQLVSAIIRKSFNYNGYKKNSRTYEIIGISFEELKIYLESKFEDWMTWENRGLYNGEFNYGWDIDHIIPLSSAKTKEDIIRLNHYTNLQPLCSKVNRDIKKDN